MFDAYFLEFDLDMKKADHIFETASDKLDISALEIYTLENSGMFESSEDPDEMFSESAGKFMEAIKAFFKKIKDSIKKLYLSIKDAIENAIRKHEMKKKLKELRDAIKSSKEMQKSLSSSKSEISDTTKLYKAYCEYMDTVLKEIRKVYSKTYESIDEYTDAVEKSNAVIYDKADKLGMSVFDTEVVNMTFDKAFSFTEKESDNISKLTEMYMNKWLTSTDELEKIALSQDDASKISDIKGFISKCNSTMSQGLRNIQSSWQKNYKTIIATAAAAASAAGVVIGGAIGIKAHKNAKNINDSLKRIESMGTN